MNRFLQILQSKRTVAILLAIIVLFVAVSYFGKQEAEPEAAAPLKAVVVTTAATLSADESVTLVGKVRAFSEAGVTAERGGQITSVTTTLGATVRAGQVIATLENSAESAAVLQAQGAYEAAQAAASQTGISVNEATIGVTSAEDALVNTLRGSYTTINQVVRNNIDTYFSNPDSSVPGLRVDGRGNTSAINNERVAYQTLLPQWQSDSLSVSRASDLNDVTTKTIANLNRTIAFVDMFIDIFNRSSDRDSSPETQAAIANFTALRANLLGTIAGIEAGQTAILRAEENLTRAQQSASGSGSSAADAQVKQALGALRAAQSNYAKTVLRTPVSGTVNELSVRVGDFVAGQTKIAQVANNNTLEIVAYANSTDLFVLQPGDSVVLENKYEGIVTTVAPAIDSATGKTEIRIATDNPNITNGDTVRITTEVSTEDLVSEEVRVPLTAVKFEREDGFMFKVEDGRLVKFPVTLGSVFGTTVAIEEGLSLADNFVLDARGLIEGESVSVTE